MKQGSAFIPGIALWIWSALAAHAAEFNIDGSTIHLTNTTYTSTQSNEQDVKGVGSLPSNTQTSTGPGTMTFQLFNGKQVLAWQATALSCKIDGNFTSVSILYKIGGKNTGAVTCDGQTSGTDVDLTTELPTKGTYESDTRIAGNEVHLSGTMTIKKERSYVTKGGILAGTQRYIATLVVEQAAVLELIGKTCKVRSLSWTTREVEDGEVLSGGVESTTRQIRHVVFATTDQTVCQVL